MLYFAVFIYINVVKLNAIIFMHTLSNKESNVQHNLTRMLYLQ
jgi:hypothetical protein